MMCIDPVDALCMSLKLSVRHFCDVRKSAERIFEVVFEVNKLRGCLHSTDDVQGPCWIGSDKMPYEK